MKKVINFVFSVLICNSVIAQNNDVRAQFSEELCLSKSQNNTAWILTGGWRCDGNYWFGFYQFRLGLF
jgi:hypothetical protein